MDYNKILEKPILTEKSLSASSHGQYTFRVNKKASKNQIKQAIEEIFSVKVKGIKTIAIPAKPKRWGKRNGHTKSYRKALVSLVKGKIDLFEMK